MEVPDGYVTLHSIPSSGEAERVCKVRGGCDILPCTVLGVARFSMLPVVSRS